ncbi:MAG: hypothetical protein V5B33_18645 [Candidatus Accumulibacter sp. UW20]
MAIADQSDGGNTGRYRATHRLVPSSLAGGNFFRIWKSGCKVEALQLGTLERLERALVIYLIIAWRILYLVTWGRECPALPCEVVFDREE